MTEVRSITVITRGRYLSVPPAGDAARAPTLVGFHGYGENAETQLERLRAIPGSEQWRIISIQGLNRFYQRRTNQVVAGWMTSQDRESAIADNIAYVKACIETESPAKYPVIFAGFSQGVAMAFRAAAHAVPRAAGVIAVGGDVPPELEAADLCRIGAVLIARGAADEWYKEGQFADDQRRLSASVPVRGIALRGGHEWPDDLIPAAAEFLRERFQSGFQAS